MSRPAPRTLFMVALFSLTLASAAHAATFDLIWADRLNVTTYPANVGFTLAGADIGLVVNKGLTNITAAEFFGATFTCTSSNPAVSAYPFINNPGPAITPILPNQALGSVLNGVNNVLTTKLLPGETFHNTAPLQVIAMQVNYPGGFAGVATLDLTMTIGTNTAHYAIQVTFVQGSNFALSFPSAARVSSTSIVTAVRHATWGTIKNLYR